MGSTGQRTHPQKLLRGGLALSWRHTEAQASTVASCRTTEVCLPLTAGADWNEGLSPLQTRLRKAHFLTCQRGGCRTLEGLDVLSSDSLSHRAKHSVRWKLPAASGPKPVKLGVAPGAESWFTGSREPNSVAQDSPPALVYSRRGLVPGS